MNPANSRSIEHLHPNLLARFRAFDTAMKAEGIAYILTSTYRSPAEQDRLYAAGRTAPGKRVTTLRGGQSKHNFEIDGKPASKAFDIVIMDGKVANWNVKDPRWSRAGAIGKAVGLTWGGDWTRFKDMPHFEIA